LRAAAAPAAGTASAMAPSYPMQKTNPNFGGTLSTRWGWGHR